MLSANALKILNDDGFKSTTALRFYFPVDDKNAKSLEMTWQELNTAAQELVDNYEAEWCTVGSIKKIR